MTRGRESRPTPDKVKAAMISTAIKNSFRVAVDTDEVERQRRTSLRQALTRAARNLEPTDPHAAALARHWAEVAA